MMDIKTGRDDVRYHAMTVAMTAYMTRDSARDGYRSRALVRLVAAVEVEAEARGACRDLSLTAATRVRAW